MNSLENDSPILLFKDQGLPDESGHLKHEDFQLVIMTPFQKLMLNDFGNNIICVDTTHGTNAYDFNLTTLLIVDEFGAGCPVAYLFSNRIDAGALKLFFLSIKNKVGDVKANVFMSDDAPALYN
jgi:hypothetical protein